MKSAGHTKGHLQLVGQSYPQSAAALTRLRPDQEWSKDLDPSERNPTELDEELQLVERARVGDKVAFELLMRRNNQRVYRVIRAIIHDAAEIEDVMQQAYLQAFTHLDQFSGASRWSTWLCRIAINEAKARGRQRTRLVPMDMTTAEAEVQDDSKNHPLSPEQTLCGRELGRIVEQAIDRLPEIYRSVLMMREVEGMSTSETAQVLAIDSDAVKTRLHRARNALRSAIEERIGEGMNSVHEFGNERCDRLVAVVLGRLTMGR